MWPGAAGARLGRDGDDPAACAMSAAGSARFDGATAREEVEMADYSLVVGAFKDADGADQALPAVKQAARDRGMKVRDAGIVRRTADGQVQIKDTGDWGFVKGAIAGGVVTGVAAIIAGPIGWGALAAAGLAGGVIAKVHDANIKDNALRDLGTQAKQAGSALVIMVEPFDEAAIGQALKEAGAVATTVGLDE